VSSSESEHRKHPRYAVDVEATLYLPGGPLLKGRTRDLSRTGICLITVEDVPAGLPVQLDLVLSFGENSFSEPLTLGARVVWCTNIAGSYQVGAMFDDLSEEQDGFLDMFLHFLDGTLSPKGVPVSPMDDEEEPSPDEKDDPFR
jgi:hypothetical protein